MWLAIVIAILFAVSCYAFARADADISLLLKGKAEVQHYQGKVVWITGASQGLGEELARQLAGLRARLILSSRQLSKLEDVKARCCAATGCSRDDIMVLPFDLTSNFDALEAAVEAAEKMFDGQGVDIIIHVAGASQHALVEDTTADVTRELFNINTFAPILLTRALLPRMLSRRRGQVVVISSMSGKLPAPGQAVYSACKHAVMGYFSSLASEVADRGVKVTICCPGPVGTGSADKPRMVYGATGAIVKNDTSASNKRITVPRCAELVLRATAHGCHECWIARHPVLLLCYVMQFMPAVGWAVMKLIGPGRARALKSGKSGYDIGAMLGSKKRA